MYLQKDKITMDIATNLFTLIDDFIIILRNKFDLFESSALKKNPKSEIQGIFVLSLPVLFRHCFCGPVLFGTVSPKGQFFSQSFIFQTSSPSFDV